MPSSENYAQYIIKDCLSLVDKLTFKKMMGEYLLYSKNILFGGIYDDRFLIKKTTAAKTMLSHIKEELPYKGAKTMYLVSELEDKSFLSDLVEKTCLLLSKPNKPGK